MDNGLIAVLGTAASTVGWVLGLLVLALMAALPLLEALPQRRRRRAARGTAPVPGTSDPGEPVEIPRQRAVAAHCVPTTAMR